MDERALDLLERLVENVCTMREYLCRLTLAVETIGVDYAESLDNSPPPPNLLEEAFHPSRRSK